MKMPSSSAQDRQVSVWFQKIENGEIKLPRFQRHQAWDKNRITSLLDTVTRNLPLGVTLLLNVDKEQFVSRYLVTAPETGGASDRASIGWSAAVNRTLAGAAQ